MKITQKTNDYIFASMLIHLTCIAVSCTLELLGKILSTPLNYFLYFLTNLSYFITIGYLIYILKLMNERKIIIVSFIVYSCFFLATAFILFKPDVTHLKIYYVLAFISGGLAINLFIQMFWIKKQTISTSFRFLAIAMLIKAIIKIGALPFMALRLTRPDFLVFKHIIAFFDLLPPFATLYILYKTSVYLNHEQRLFKQASLSTDEPA